MLRYKRALDTWLSEGLVAEAVEAMLDLEDEIGGPDAIVSDPFLSASAIAAELLDVPLDHLRLAGASDSGRKRVIPGAARFEQRQPAANSAALRSLRH